VTSDTPREARWTTSRQLFEFLSEKGKNWRKHCHKHGACKQPVYFVRDGWYNNVYVPGYQPSTKARATARVTRTTESRSLTVPRTEKQRPEIIRPFASRYAGLADKGERSRSKPS